MTSPDIKISGFSLSKHRDLTGDDAYDAKTVADITIAVVCDGVGSADAGAHAASRTVSYFMNNFSIRPKMWSIEKSIKTFISSINSILYQESMLNYNRSELVTTLAVIVIQGDRLYGANVGDSRIYLSRDKQISQLSRDHTMTKKGYENVLTQAIGMQNKVEPYYFENIVQPNDILLLCSDGLYNTLTVKSDDLKYGAVSLVKKASKTANDNLNDDTTAVVLEIIGINEMYKIQTANLPTPGSLHVAQEIDGYTLESSLASNNRIWLASKKNKRYVLKFAPIRASDDKDISNMFAKEAWNAKRLKNRVFPRAVVPKNRSCRYYVMQYIDGIDLHSYLQNNRLSIDDAIDMTKMLLRMSQYLLRRDLVHGDIKPQNILLEKNNEKINFKMVDFGSIIEIFSISSKAGTPSFLSPQRFQNEAINESSEIFAIGVTLYYSLCRKYPYNEIEPFYTPTFKEVVKPSTFNTNIPNWLDSIILRAIAIDTDTRYAHYSEMLYELESPKNVKPFFSKNSSIIQRSPVLFYKTAFIIMFIINIVLLVALARS